MSTINLAKRLGTADRQSALSCHSTRLRIKIFGPLTVYRGDTELSAGDLGGPKPRQVLEILLLNSGTAVSKTRLMELLWGGNHPAVALPTLESYVSVLRRHLQPGTGRSGPIRTVTGGYAIDKALVDLDLDRFEMLTKQGSQAPPAKALKLFTEALELATAPLLGDELLPAWAEDERALYASRVASVQVAAAEAALAAGEPDRAIVLTEPITQKDPLNERAWTALILGLERHGEAAEALKAFDHYRRVMDRELGCTPNQTVREAQARLLASTAVSSLPSYGVEGSQQPGGPQTASVVPQQEPERMRILIVDDHTTFSELLAGALDREPDFRSVGTAQSVASAVTKFQQTRPDVVIMDLYLIDGSGLTAAEHILALEPRTRIVMLTGNPSQEALRHAAGMGICAFLPKDGALGVMLDTLRHARAGNMIVHPTLVAGLGTTVVAPGAAGP
ncbi:BTAD domain-containing putative transcriptional regulator [Paenarthrobacter ureafaciens]|uniref:BTAD domain-containing putative transcriptional regulator n=1 Tax=Paenarthrobacter ureafaciens TaxID=37931 RepID=UPI0022643CBA|nr:BTAD domain-containing putative transcriptional regulator [Paenarthrobacter ureafaciens]MCX8453702.1 BTAD domain-containing putative transcriptional regulator [Paenarthrobacter ureafaciens]MCY0973361.1 BTAD domain-containing putative transcriptional regulator [Paenarthrobacter ureafaciens]